MAEACAAGVRSRFRVDASLFARSSAFTSGNYEPNRLISATKCSNAIEESAPNVESTPLPLPESSAFPEDLVASRSWLIGAFARARANHFGMPTTSCRSLRVEESAICQTSVLSASAVIAAPQQP